MYLTCDKLPLDIYVDCLLDQDLSGLLIDGEATEEQLQSAWDKIYLQSCQLSNSDNYNQVFKLTQKINDIRAKITMTNNIITHLRMSFDQELVDILNSLALMCDIKEEDTGAVLVTKLNTVVAYMKKWFPELELKEKELEEIRSKNAGKTDRAYFDNWLDALSEDKGYQIEAAKITVSRFYRSMNKLSDKIRLMDIQNQLHGRSTG